MYAAILAHHRRDRERFQLVDRVRGPLHRIAGRYVWSGLPGLFGDYATACGLTLPQFSVVTSSEPEYVGSRSRCGDCFPLTQGGSPS